MIYKGPLTFILRGAMDSKPNGLACMVVYLERHGLMDALLAPGAELHVPGCVVPYPRLDFLYSAIPDFVA